MKRGFIGWLLLVIIALALAKYFFDWSIFDALNSEKGRETLDYMKNVLSAGWTYVKSFVLYLWQKVQGIF